MSTYLLAFAIGDFARASAKSKSGVTVQTMAISHLKAGLENAVQVAVECINAMEKLTNVSYPLAKLDNVDMVTMGFKFF